MNKLEIAERKLERIRNEQEDTQIKIKNENNKIPFGQPNIMGRTDIYKNVKRNYEKSMRLYEEEKEQEQRIEMLEKVEEFKENNEGLKDVHTVGKSGWATVGAKTSVNNLEYFKNKLIELEQMNEEAKAYNKTKPAIKKQTYGTKITELKNKIALLETMKEKDENKTVGERATELIESEKVNQWKKKPIYYFVKGYKKVALELDENGNFFISRRYPCYDESDRKEIEELIK